MITSMVIVAARFLLPLKVRFKGGECLGYGLFKFYAWKCWRVLNARFASPPPVYGRWIVYRRSPGNVYLIAIGYSTFLPQLARRRLRRALACMPPGIEVAEAAPEILKALGRRAYKASRLSMPLGRSMPWNSLLVIDGEKWSAYALGPGKSLSIVEIPVRSLQRGKARRGEEVLKKLREEVYMAWSSAFTGAMRPAPRESEGVRVGVVLDTGETLAIAPGHIAVFGKTGVGKTSMLWLLARRLARAGNEVVVVDFFGEYVGLGRYGCAVVDSLPDPLSLCDPISAVERLDTAIAIAFGDRYRLTPIQFDLAYRAALRCYKRGGISVEGVVKELGFLRKHAASSEEKVAALAVVRRLIPLLRPYSQASPPKGCVVYDLSNLSDLGKSLVADSILDMLLRSRESGKPVYVIVDEAHRLASHGLVSGSLERLLREGRGLKVYVILADQSPSRISRAAWAQADTFILFRTHEVWELEGLMSREEMEALKSLPPRRCLVNWGGGGWIHVEVDEAPRLPSKRLTPLEERGPVMLSEVQPYQYILHHLDEIKGVVEIAKAHEVDAGKLAETALVVMRRIELLEALRAFSRGERISKEELMELQKLKLVKGKRRKIRNLGKAVLALLEHWEAEEEAAWLMGGLKGR